MVAADRNVDSAKDTVKEIGSGEFEVGGVHARTIIRDYFDPQKDIYSWSSTLVTHRASIRLWIGPLSNLSVPRP